MSTDIDTRTLRRRGTYFPDEDRTAYDELIDSMWRRRFTTFVVLAMHLRSSDPGFFASSGFGAAFDNVVTRTREARRKLCREPAFLAWINLALTEIHRQQNGSTSARAGLRRLVADFPALLVRIEARTATALRIEGTSVLVQRFDVDPLVARVTPPTYRFPVAESRRKTLLRSSHSVAFFRDVVTIALRHIEAAWPECYRMTIDLVKVIGYLPDAEFRSCSAARYVGVIYLAARDNSLLDVEESLVHEAGHQLLYTIADGVNLTEPSGPADPEYILPWSGKTRDFYGYLHAFYIYTLLVRYFDRVVSASTDLHSTGARRKARERMILLLRGLVAAWPDFESNPALTTAGAQLCGALRIEIDRLTARYSPELGAAAPVATGSPMTTRDQR